MDGPWGRLDGGHTIGMEKEFLIVTGDGTPVDCSEVEHACNDSRVHHDYPSALGFDVFGIELNSNPYSDLAGLTDEMRGLVEKVRDEAQDRGYKLMTAARHPERGGFMAMHVHIGAADEREALYVTKALRAHLPEIAALASNSPKKDRGRWCKDGRMFSTNDGGSHYGREVPTDVTVYGDLDKVRREVEGHKRIRWDGRGVVIAANKDTGELKGTIEVRCPDAQLTADEDVAVAAFIWGIAEKAKRDLAAGGYDFGAIADKERERDRLQRELDGGYGGGFIGAIGRGVRTLFGRGSADDARYASLRSELEAADAWLGGHRPGYDVEVTDRELKRSLDDVAYSGMDGTITYHRGGERREAAAKDAVRETYESIKPVLEELRIPDAVRERLEARVYGGRSGADAQIEAFERGVDPTSYIVERSTNMEYLL